MRLSASTLYAVRKVYGCTQARLGQLLGVSDAYINMIERGKRPLTDDFDRRVKQALDLDDVRLSEVLAIYERFNIERHAL